MSQKNFFLNPSLASIKNKLLQTPLQNKSLPGSFTAGSVFLSFHWRHLLPKNTNTAVATAADAGAPLWVHWGCCFDSIIRPTTVWEFLMTTILLSKTVSPYLFYSKINQPCGESRTAIFCFDLEWYNIEIIMITNTQYDKKDTRVRERTKILLRCISACPYIFTYIVYMVYSIF